MFRSPNKLHNSESDLTNVKETSGTGTSYVITRKRKHDQDLEELFRLFTKDMQDTIKNWKTDFNKELTKNTKELKLEINNVRKEYQEMKSSIKDLNVKQTEIAQEVKILQNSFQYHSDQYDDFNLKITQVTNDIKKLEIMEKTVEEVNRQNIKLQRDLNANEQRERQSNVEVIGIPETINEDLRSYMSKIATKAGLQISLDDILEVHRITPKVRIQGRPRMIILKLKSRLLKDNFISKVRKYHPTTKDIGLPGDAKSIFVYENLTTYNKGLLKKIKDIAKSKQYQFIWVKNGKIYVRKSDTFPAIHINSEEDFTKL
ncbi:uncharacterized protein LOC131849175 [Achroia grisella]|uniref:uncharacterized protein LOC131849175 n=1 Tax=Achroia grisella TaxID=688607 RepID=UPI0027D2E6D0|nr:uncharacterized protein LOC131849175 [Achroia grisella]